jgi:protein-disulfide isomerase
VVDPTYSAYLPQLAECADQQQEGMFWPTYEVLYQLATDGQVGPSVAQDLAARLGLNANTLAQCAQTATQVYTDRQLALTLGISGTPGVMVQYGDDDPQYIVVNGQTYSSGGPPIQVLGFAVEHISGMPIGAPA